VVEGVSDRFRFLEVLGFALIFKADASQFLWFGDLNSPGPT
jgi:hypothetical protein